MAKFQPQSPSPSQSESPASSAPIDVVLYATLTGATAPTSTTATGAASSPSEGDCRAETVHKEVEQHAEGAEGEEDYRRKWLVLVCSIGLVISFNFFYSFFFLVAWGGLPGEPTPDYHPAQAAPDARRWFAAFALVSNAFHLSLLALLYRTGRLYVAAALFLAYLDLGICAVCLYFGIIIEFYMWLTAVVAMAFYIFGRRASRIFLLVVLLEGLLLYPCSVYVFAPVAPLALGPLERLVASVAMMVCVGTISQVHECSCQATLIRLREANDKLRRSSEAKTLFLSAITHELRTPLTGIIGMAHELLYDEAKDNVVRGATPPQSSTGDQDERCCDRQRQTDQLDERMETVRIIVTCARHLLGLVNDVLDFEKIESRQLDLECIPFNVKREAEMVVSMLASTAASHRVRLEKDMRLAHCIRLGDPLRLRQVIFNLLSNAIKFTPPAGTVTLSLSDDGYDYLRVEVRDTGIGISETAMKNLFKHFSQGGTGVCRQYGGSGLGLAICKNLVEAMQGQICCSSPGTNKGSTFWFTLPLPVTCAEAFDTSSRSSSRDLLSSAPCSPSSSSPSSPVAGCVVPHPQQAPDFRGMKVLLVEDNLVNQKVCRRLLEHFGCDVHVAENGLECINLLQRGPYSLIFMDCQMPVLDGYEATRRIREKERAEQGGRTPIVALTASCVKSDRQVCLDSGMDDWMAKPFDQAALYNALLKWATLHAQPFAPSTPTPRRLSM